MKDPNKITEKKKWRLYNQISPAKPEPLYYLISSQYSPILLRIDKPFRIGRDKSNDLVLPYPEVSRFQCVIEWQGTRYILRDQNSANGTFVNDSLTTTCYLEDGDKIHVGQDVLEFRKILPDSTTKVESQDTSKETLRVEHRIVRYLQSASQQSSFHGDLATVGLSTILQMLAMLSKSGQIMVQSSLHGSGSIVLENGLVVNSQYKEITGQSAFWEIMQWDEGIFKFDEGSVAPEEKTMCDPVEALLLEFARLKDENEL